MPKLYYACFIVLLSHAAHAQKKTTDSTSKELIEVTVKAQKNPIEILPGKTVVNVQDMASNAGKNLLDVLRNMPGVLVDGQGNVTLNGKQGVLITINGRPTYLSGEDLREYLRSLTAEEIGQVEIMAQPPAQFDAAGDAGVINIKLRKSRRLGFNGSATAAFSKSLTYSSHNTLLLNYRKGKINTYASLNYINAKGTVRWSQDYAFRDAIDNVMATSSMVSVPVEVFEKNNERLGLDYYYSDKTTMGVCLTGAYYGNTMHSEISFTDKANGSTTYTTRNTWESSLRQNGGANAYLKHTFSKQSELDINLDYLLYTRTMDQYLNTAADKDGVQLTGQLELRSKLPYYTQVRSARLDQTFALPSGIGLEMGAKYSYVTMDNDARYEVKDNSNWVHDGSRTNHFLYKENIGALYVKGTKKFGDKWDAQLGLRGEYADMLGMQLTTGQQVHRELPALFPTAFVLYKPDSQNNIELNYGRRVNRPEYRSLNTFNYYTFYNTYQRGNPYLLPEYTHSTNLRHTYKSHWITNLQLYITTNALGFLNVADAATQTTYGMPVNFKTNKQAILSFGYNGKVSERWDMVASLYSRYVTYGGMAGNQAVSAKGLGYGGYFQNQFTFGKWEAECMAHFSTDMPGSPVSTDKAKIYMNMGVSRTLLKGDLKVTMYVDDPFYIYSNNYEIFQPDLIGKTSFRPNSRNVSVTATYTFGRSSNRSTEKRDNAPDEAKRAQ
jgi:hypothetical protein